MTDFSELFPDVADLPDAPAGAGLQQRDSNVAGFKLMVDGADISDKAKPRLVSLSLTEQRGGEADQLDLVLSDADGLLEIPKKGALIALQLGWLRGTQVRVGLIDKGKFTVDQVSWGGPPDQVTIHARSADLTAGFRARKEAVHKNTTLGAIARKIAADNGYTAKIADELDHVAVPVLAQHHKSDMALLRQLGKQHDAVATIKNKTLILAPMAKAASAGGKPMPMLTLGKSDLASGYNYQEIDRSAEAGVEARWHDQDSATRKTVKAGGGDSAKGKPRRLRKVYHTEADAKAAAKAEAARAKRAEATFDGTMALGRPDVTPERPVTLKAFKPRIDEKKWIVGEITHTLDGNGGLASKFKLEVKD